MRALVPVLIVLALSACAANRASPDTATIAGPVVVAQIADGAPHESCGGR